MFTIPQELIEKFCERRGDDIKNISYALDCDDFIAIKNIAHQLKGSAPGYGFSVLGEEAASVESIVKTKLIDGKRLQEPDATDFTNAVNKLMDSLHYIHTHHKQKEV